MRRKNAFSDFVGNTLSPIGSTWGKLVYLNDLKSSSKNRYAHWGMEHYHGVINAQLAIKTAHQDLIRNLLTLRCDEVLEEVQLFADLRGMPLMGAFRALSDEIMDSLPEVSKSETSHIRVLLLTVEALLAASGARVA
jgi:hypothetical protein